MDPIFGLGVPAACEGVPTELLSPTSGWNDEKSYNTAAEKLARLFNENFLQYADGANDAVQKAGPLLTDMRSSTRTRTVIG